MDQDYVDKQIDAKIIEINNNDNVYEVGTVVNVKDFIIEATGIGNVMFYEKINIANKAIGYVNNINESTVTIAVLKINSPINVGDMVYSTNTLYQGEFSPSSFGRVIDLFGVDKLTGKKFNDLIQIPIERKTIPIMDRGSVNRPLLTGITGIDLMYPIGRGQRQLIIGDKRTGKTQIGLDTIVNQRDQNVLCFYVAIGKTKKEVKNIYAELMKKGALDYTIIITAFNDELPPVISLIPYFALSIAENYMMEGSDVLVVIDDLKRHAEAYREISLISGKTPGRDAYPADIFYTHSRLLEKGCQHKNGGSITILPIVETKGGDITDYISTNIISITDGQIVLSSKSFQKGEKPAIDYGLSVSRLGGAVQEKNMKVVGSVVRRKLLSYLETRNIYELVNMDEMSFELKNQFMEGKIILDNMMQYKFSPRTPAEMLDLFAGLVETDEDENSSDSSTDEVAMANNEVFETPAQTIPEDGSIFDNDQTVVMEEPVPEPVSEEIPKESPVLIEQPVVENVTDLTQQDVSNLVNVMPEEIPATQVEENIPTDPIDNLTSQEVHDAVEVPDESASSSEVLEVPSATDLVDNLTAQEVHDAVEVPEDSLSEEQNPVSEVPEVSETTDSVDDVTAQEVYDTVNVSPNELPPNSMPEEIPSSPTEEISYIPAEEVMATVDVQPTKETKETKETTVDDVTMGTTFIDPEQVRATVEEKVVENDFEPAILSDMGVEPANDMEEKNSKENEEISSEYPVQENVDIQQNVSIDNPQTVEDESIVKQSLLPEEVFIEYPTQENTMDIPKIVQSETADKSLDIQQNVSIDNPQTVEDESIVAQSPHPEEVSIEYPIEDNNIVKKEDECSFAFDPALISISTSVITEDSSEINHSDDNEGAEEEEVI